MIISQIFRFWFERWRYKTKKEHGVDFHEVKDQKEKASTDDRETTP